MVAGAMLVALLAVVADLVLAAVQRLVVSPGLRAGGPRARRPRCQVARSKAPDAARAA